MVLGGKNLEEKPEPEQSKDCYSIAEASEMIRALAYSKTGLRRLKQIAVCYIYKALRPSMSEDDLVSEAILRIIDGRRKWPRNLAPTTFVKGVIRSIVSERMKQMELLPETVLYSDNPPEIRDEVPNSEERLAAIQLADIVIRSFSDDEQAQRLIVGRSLGLNGQQLKEYAGILDQKTFETVAKRVARRLERDFPEGALS